MAVTSKAAGGAPPIAAGVPQPIGAAAADVFKLATTAAEHVVQRMIGPSSSSASAELQMACQAPAAATVTVPKQVLKRMLDSVDRAAAAAAHAVKISAHARNAFEEEHRRLLETRHDLQEMISRVD